MGLILSNGLMEYTSLVYWIAVKLRIMRSKKQEADTKIIFKKPALSDNSTDTCFTCK
jgi:hypothetical protein